MFNEFTKYSFVFFAGLLPICAMENELGLTEKELHEAFQAAFNFEYYNQGKTLPVDFSDQKASDEALARQLQELLNLENYEFVHQPNPATAATQDNFSCKPGITDMVYFNSDLEKHRQLLRPIWRHLESTPQHSDVHVLDGHVNTNFAAVLNVGMSLGVDNPDLTVEQMKQYLISNSGFYTNYDGTAVSPAELTGYINSALDTAGTDGSVREMYSRVISSIQRLEAEGVNTDGQLQLLLDALAENYLTRGGCFAGVKNRVYVRYVDILGNLVL